MTDETVQEAPVKPIKTWPKEYYASRNDCLQKHLRKSSPIKARKMGVLGWRVWDYV